jgi:hypothetical protein
MMKQRYTRLQVELLEDRTVPSGTSIAGLIALPMIPVEPLIPMSSTPAPATSTIPTVAGPTLHATVGVQFSGVVGFYASPVLDPPLAYSATVKWGDGSGSDATLSYGQYNGQFGYLISSTHTFAKAGIDNVKVTLIEGPINPAIGLPTRLVEFIADKAIVNSSTGVTISESVGKKFTADLGTFTAIAGFFHLSATITWGDGSTFKGTITAIGVQGIDVIQYKVAGTHTYKKTGMYPIHIVVNEGSPIGANPLVVATIDSSAVVKSDHK